MDKSKTPLTKIFGYILLTPPLLSVPLFLYQFFTYFDVLNHFRNKVWTGNIDVDGGYGGGGGYTSALPLYFGLMAIAGGLLIKDSK